MANNISVAQTFERRGTTVPFTANESLRHTRARIYKHGNDRILEAVIPSLGGGRRGELMVVPWKDLPDFVPLNDRDRQLHDGIPGIVGKNGIDPLQRSNLLDLVASGKSGSGGEDKRDPATPEIHLPQTLRQPGETLPSTELSPAQRREFEIGRIQRDIVRRRRRKLMALFGRLAVDDHCRALARQVPPADLVVFGHLHIPIDRTLAGTRFYSPGSVYQPELDPAFSWDGAVRRLYARVRRRLPASAKRPAVGLVEVDGSEMTITTRYLRRPLVPDGPAPT